MRVVAAETHGANGASPAGTVFEQSWTAVMAAGAMGRDRAHLHVDTVKAHGQSGACTLTTCADCT